MKRRLGILVSLVTKENDYQRAQALAAEDSAQKLGVNLEVLYADGDSVTQSQQLLKAIQNEPGLRPNGILVQPVGGTGLPQVARAAVSAGIGWGVMNREVSYTAELRQTSKVAVFSIGPDHRAIGSIQGQQVSVLLPKGGNVLYIQGPAGASATQQRAWGLQGAIGPQVELTQLKGDWTQAGAQRAVSSWLSLATSRKTQIDLVAAQNDTMAIGARQAIEENISEEERGRWLQAPFLGVDGLPKTGQSWVRSGLLRATIIVPPSTALAIETMVQALEEGRQPPETKFTDAQSFPGIETLAPPKRERATPLASK